MKTSKPLKVETAPTVAQEPKPAAASVDPCPPAPPITAGMVAAVSRTQTEQGRLTRLRTLARSNPDVAWLLGRFESRKKP
jgi:hypothetical protein